MSVPLLAALALCCGAGPQEGPGKQEGPPLATEFAKLKAAVSKFEQEITKEFLAAKTEKEKEAVVNRALERQRKEGLPLAAKALALVRPRPGDAAAVEVLTWVLNSFPASPEAAQAADLLVQHHLKDQRTLQTAARFRGLPLPWTEKLLRALAAADLPRDKKAFALFTLAESLKTAASLPAQLKEVDPATLKRVELQYGKDLLERLRAIDAAKTEAEAIRLFKEIAAKYGDEKYGGRTMAEQARTAIFEIEHLAVGKVAPDIEGEDLDGVKFKLSDYRGKVVLLDFWGDW